VKQYKAKVNSPDHKYTTGVLLHNTIRGGNEKVTNITQPVYMRNNDVNEMLGRYIQEQGFFDKPCTDEKSCKMVLRT